MSDGNLLIFGCAVLFTAFAGAYVYLRDRFAEQKDGEAASPALPGVAHPRPSA
jgi:hypothetical protein